MKYTAEMASLNVETMKWEWVVCGRRGEGSMASEVCMDKAMCKSQTARSPGVIRTYPITMGIQGSLYSCDFGDPIFCLWKFTTCLTLAVQVQFSRNVKCKMSECKVARSGAGGIVWDWSIAKIGEQETSHDPQPEEKAKGTDGWILSTCTVSAINSTPRNVKPREEFAMMTGFAARVLSSLFMISFTVIQEFIVLLISDIC